MVKLLSSALKSNLAPSSASRELTPESISGTTGIFPAGVGRASSVSSNSAEVSVRPPSHQHSVTLAGRVALSCHGVKSDSKGIFFPYSKKLLGVLWPCSPSHRKAAKDREVGVRQIAEGLDIGDTVLFLSFDQQRLDFLRHLHESGYCQ